MLYCTNCGQRRVEGAPYCHNCGRLIGPSDLLTGHPPGMAEGDQEAESVGVPWRGGQVALAVLAMAVLVFPAALAAFAVGRLAGRYEEAAVTWVSVHLIGLAIIGVVWFLGVRRCRAPVWVLGLAPLGFPRPKTVFMTVGVLGASLGATAVYAALVDALGSDLLSPPEIPPDIAFPGPAVVFTFQALALATPLTEEIFFRGFVFRGLAPRLGVRWAMVSSAVIFGMFHLSPGVLVPIFMTGLLLAWLYWRTGSLWPSIFAHAGQNALVLAIQVYVL